MGHRIIVKVLPDGSSEIKVDGMAGGKCKDVTKALERSLGKTTSDKKTADFYKKEEATLKQNLKN